MVIMGTAAGSRHMYEKKQAAKAFLGCLLFLTLEGIWPPWVYTCKVASSATEN
ncbi:hypothetical protein PALA111701_06285 [Paenibacillus lactis]